jgi:hypothetical protein
VFPKLNKLVVVPGTTGFTTLITVLAEDALKFPLLELLSDKGPWIVCSLVEAGVLDPLPKVLKVASCGAMSHDILDTESDAFKDEFSEAVEDCGLPKIKGTPDEVTTVLLMGSTFSSVGATLLDDGAGINTGTFCSAETAELVGDDNFNVKLDVV